MSRATHRVTRPVIVNDHGTVRELWPGQTLDANREAPAIIRAGLTNTWLEPLPRTPAPEPERETHVDPDAEARLTTAEPAAPRHRKRASPSKD